VDSIYKHVWHAASSEMGREVTGWINICKFR
jgi:hypothetical protein